jgi:hypothetical protein
LLAYQGINAFVKLLFPFKNDFSVFYMGAGILDEGFVKLVKGKIRQGIFTIFKINGDFITRLGRGTNGKQT